MKNMMKKGAEGFAYSMDGISRDDPKVAVERICNMLCRNLRKAISDFRCGDICAVGLWSRVNDGRRFLNVFDKVNPDLFRFGRVAEDFASLYNVLSRSIACITDDPGSYCSELERKLVFFDSNIASELRRFKFNNPFASVIAERSGAGELPLASLA